MTLSNSSAHGMTDTSKTPERKDRYRVFMRETHVLLATGCIAFGAIVFVFGRLPDRTEAVRLANEYLGVGLHFFAAIAVFLVYVTAAFVLDTFSLTTPRRWSGLNKALYYSQHSAMWVGLCVTLISFASGLSRYSENFSNGADARQAFLSEIATAVGSTLTGTALALIAFSLAMILPTDEGGE